MHPAEDDILRLFLRGRIPRQLKTVPDEIRELHHRILLIVMPKDHNPTTKVIPGFPNSIP
jgi:hypothetical protein